MKTNKKKNIKGFTLVELIVVLVILGILAAILIPSLTGWIDKARQASAISECQYCVTAAQSISDEYYGKNTVFDEKKTSLTDPTSLLGDIEKLAEAKGKLQYVTFSKAIVTELLYKASNGMYVKFDGTSYSIVSGEDADDGYTDYTGKSPSADEINANMAAIYNMTISYLKKNNCKQLEGNFSSQSGDGYIRFLNNKGEHIKLSSTDFIDSLKNKLGVGSNLVDFKIIVSNTQISKIQIKVKGDTTLFGNTTKGYYNKYISYPS